MKLSYSHRALPGIVAVIAVGVIPTIPPAAKAGEPQADPKDSKTITVPPPESPWKFELGVPSWLAASSGNVGLFGVSSHSYTDVATLFRHLNFTTAFETDIRYDRFGFYGDFLYANISQTNATPGLVRKLSGGLAQWQSTMELYYRVVDTPQWSLDLRAGTRYTNLFSQVNIYPNESAINAASAKLVDTAASDLRATLQRDLRNVLNQRNPSLPIPPLAFNQNQKLLTAIQNLKADPELAATVQAQLAAATPALKASLQASVDAAKKNLQNKIASALKKNLNNSFTLSEAWWDPYIGFGGRYNLNKSFYLTGKADIGGFTIGSQITWMGYVGLGYNLSSNIFAEVGYKYLYTNYRGSDGFIYDMSQSGVQVLAGIKF